jgi:predicted site-specific integrase-resolvase
MPIVMQEEVLVVPALPMFSPAAIAELLTVNRCTVHWWLENGKLHFCRDNIDERYVLREELVRFVREYLRRSIHEQM